MVGPRDRGRGPGAVVGSHSGTRALTLVPAAWDVSHVDHTETALGSCRCEGGLDPILASSSAFFAWNSASVRMPTVASSRTSTLSMLEPGEMRRRRAGFGSGHGDQMLRASPALASRVVLASQPAQILTSALAMLMR
jgi:hypothetical protein